MCVTSTTALDSAFAGSLAVVDISNSRPIARFVKPYYWHCASCSISRLLLQFFGVHFTISPACYCPQVIGYSCANSCRIEMRIFAVFSIADRHVWGAFRNSRNDHCLSVDMPTDSKRRQIALLTFRLFSLSASRAACSAAACGRIQCSCSMRVRSAVQ